MVQAVERSSVVQLEAGRYQVSLPGYGDVIIVLRTKPIAICRSCHRALTDPEEIAPTDSVVCRRCYTA